METKIFVPNCPNCNKPLEDVYENEYWTYTFDEKTGTYKGNLTDIEIRCPNCQTKLSDTFPKGTCNYQTIKDLNINLNRI